MSSKKKNVEGESGKRLLSSDKKDQNNNINKAFLDAATCSFSEKDSRFALGECFAFFLPTMIILKNGATIFGDYNTEDPLAKSVMVMFCLYIRFCQDIVKEIERNNTINTKAKTKSKKSDKKKKNDSLEAEEDDRSESDIEESANNNRQIDHSEDEDTILENLEKSYCFSMRWPI